MSVKKKNFAQNVMKKKKKKYQLNHQPKRQLDCYGVRPNKEGNERGKITFNYPDPKFEMKALGDLGKW